MQSFLYSLGFQISVFSCRIRHPEETLENKQKAYSVRPRILQEKNQLQEPKLCSQNSQKGLKFPAEVIC